MSRVPTFAGVGRLGVPVVAAAGVALWGTSLAIATSAPASAVIVAMPQQSVTPAGGQQVGVAIPSVVFGPADGLGQQVSAGRHAAVVKVWLAAGSSAAFANVGSSAGRVTGCAAISLRPAQVNTLRCIVDVPRAAGSLTLTVVTSVAGKHFHAAYEHRAG